MLDLRKLYNLRRIVDVHQQPETQLHLATLHKALLVLAHDHPYSLGPKDWAFLSGNLSYRAVCGGGLGIITDRYCYRITSWEKIKKETLPQELLLPAYYSDRDAFIYLIDEHSESGDGWLRLSTYIRGIYSGYREYTWWSTTQPTASICSAHLRGLLNSDVPPDAIVLRCPSQHIRDNRLSRVPSAVDAFFFPIFHSTTTSDSPTCGRAISVEEPNHLVLGCDEFAVFPLDIDSSGLQLWPIRWDSSDDHQVYFADVYEALVTYYKELSHGAI